MCCWVSSGSSPNRWSTGRRARLRSARLRSAPGPSPSAGAAVAVPVPAPVVAIVAAVPPQVDAVVAAQIPVVAVVGGVVDPRTVAAMEGGHGGRRGNRSRQRGALASAVRGTATAPAVNSATATAQQWSSRTLLSNSRNSIISLLLRQTLPRIPCLTAQADRRSGVRGRRSDYESYVKMQLNSLFAWARGVEFRSFLKHPSRRIFPRGATACPACLSK